MTEPTKEELRKQYRLVLVLTKGRVTERYGNTIKIHLGGTTNIEISDPKLSRSDVHAGDILTIYTEIPYGLQG